MYPGKVLVVYVWRITLRGTIVIKTCDQHKNLYIPLFLLTVVGPDYYGPRRNSAPNMLPIYIYIFIVCLHIYNMKCQNSRLLLYYAPHRRPCTDRHELGDLRWVPVLLRRGDPLVDEQLPQRRHARAGPHRRRRGVGQPGTALHHQDRYHDTGVCITTWYLSW